MLFSVCIYSSLHSVTSSIVTYTSHTLLFVSGSEVVIVKNGKRICGTGAAFSNAPINQDKAYYEVKVQSSGLF